MARGTTLTNLLTMLKAELSESLTIGAQADAIYSKLLESEQKYLASEREFPFLQERWDVSCTASTRFFTFPTTTIAGTAGVAIDYERPFLVEVKWNDDWHVLEYGIGGEQYNFQDSDNGDVLDPVRNWRYSGATQFEVWPVPSTTQTVRFTGQRALPALASGSDTAVLDDELLVLSVAIPILLKRKSADAQIKLARMQRRLQKLFGNYPAANQTFTIGAQQDSDRRTVRQAKLVVVA